MEYYKGKCVKVLTEDTEILEGKEYTVGFTPEYVKVSMAPTKSGIITQTLCFDCFCDTMFGECANL